jgi:hypothetical protein
MGYYKEAEIKGVKASDSTGEQTATKKGGVAMGKKDAVGADSLFKGGSSNKVCYTHTKGCK